MTVGTPRQRGVKEVERVDERKGESEEREVEDWHNLRVRGRGKCCCLSVDY